MFFIYNVMFFLKRKILRKQKETRDNERNLCVIKKKQANLRFFKNNRLAYTHNVSSLKRTKNVRYKEDDENEKKLNPLRSLYLTYID